MSQCGVEGTKKSLLQYEVVFAFVIKEIGVYNFNGCIIKLFPDFFDQLLRNIDDGNICKYLMY